MKVKMHDVIVKFMCLIPLTTLFSRYSFVSYCNRLLTVVMIFCLVYSIYNTGNKKTITVVGITGLVYLYGLIQTVWPIYNVNEVFYLAFWMLMLNNFVDEYNIYLKNIVGNISIIRLVVILWNIATFISFFLSSSYDDTAFYSFTGGEHRFASSSLQIFAMAALLMKVDNKKKHLLFCVIPVISVMLTGARTYMIVIAIAAVTLYYKISNYKFKFYITIIPIIIISLYFILNSTIIVDRVAEMERLTNYYGDSLRAITSGRSVWWEIDMKHFFASPILNQIFGNGFHFIRYVNTTFYGQNIWAHNDFIMLLGTNGYFGLILYFYSYLRFSLFMQKKCRFEKKKVLNVGFHSMNFINASLNMLYTYFCATLALPFLCILYFDDETSKLEQYHD